MDVSFSTTIWTAGVIHLGLILLDACVDWKLPAFSTWRWENDTVGAIKHDWWNLSSCRISASLVLFPSPRSAVLKWYRDINDGSVNCYSTARPPSTQKHRFLSNPGSPPPFVCRRGSIHSLIPSGVLPRLPRLRQPWPLTLPQHARLNLSSRQNVTPFDILEHMSSALDGVQGAGCLIYRLTFTSPPPPRPPHRH